MHLKTIEKDLNCLVKDCVKQFKNMPPEILKAIDHIETKLECDNIILTVKIQPKDSTVKS